MEAANSLDARITSIYYDHDGRVAGTIDPRAIDTDTQYDLGGRLTATHY